MCSGFGVEAVYLLLYRPVGDIPFCFVACFRYKYRFNLAWVYGDIGKLGKTSWATSTRYRKLGVGSA